MVENKNAPVTVGAADEGKAGAKLGRSLSPHTYYNEATFNRQGLFEAVRAAVPALEAARFYGLQVDQHGRALCLFHNDHRPSMTFKGARFKCWACGASGDAADLVRQLFGLTPLEAVKRLDADFSLHLGIDLPLTAEERTRARQAAEKRRQLQGTWEMFCDWKQEAIKLLEAVVRAANIALAQGRELTDAEAEAVRYQATAAYYSDVLASGDTRDQMEIFRERREVTEHCQAILKSSSPMKRKSGAA